MSHYCLIILITYLFLCSQVALTGDTGQAINPFLQQMELIDNKLSITTTQDKTVRDSLLKLVGKESPENVSEKITDKNDKSGLQQSNIKNKIKKEQKEPDFGPYMDKLHKKITANWVPPENKQRKTIIVLFTINKKGQLLKYKLIRSSKDPDSDRAAILAIKKSNPFAPLPKWFSGISIDIKFTFE